MKQKLSTTKAIIITGTIMCSSLTFQSDIRAGDIMAPGGPMNPYVVRQLPNGKSEVTTQFYSYRKNPMAPGQPANPIIIQQDRYGNYTIGTDFPANYGHEGQDE